MQIEGEGLLWSGLCYLMQLQEIELDKDKMAQAKNELPKNWQELSKWGKGWGMSICIPTLPRNLQKTFQKSEEIQRFSLLFL